MEKIKRPKFPKRVVITGGMPNGNKPLHIGHADIFIGADFYARYMRDNIGAENVLFLSGTDGFGSSTDEKYRKWKEETKSDASLSEYVSNYHNIQKKTFKDYDISIDLFSASCLKDEGLDDHIEISHYFFNKMLKNGDLKKVETEQFYDTKLNVILNGRQVEGKCPIEGCQSEVGYADECSLGHQYNCNDLIDPKSTLSNTVPKIKMVGNYYFDLDKYRKFLRELVDIYDKGDRARKFMLKDMKEYLLPPSIYVDYEKKDSLEILKNELPNFKEELHEKRKLIQLKFNSVHERDIASELLKHENISYKTNKTLAPLRISGNTSWGVPLPNLKDDSDSKSLTFYVWPESLWAPISFTKQYLKNTNSKSTWQEWWCNTDCEIVQFIGEDNVYFYALAEMGMFMSMQDKGPTLTPCKNDMQIPLIIDNKHMLLGHVKASSSGSKKAPTADELLKFYTPDQLKCYFLSLNNNISAVEFKSKAFWPNEYEGCGDPIVAPGNLLTNIFNRLVRSVFYSLQSYFNLELPRIKTSESTIKECNKLIEAFEDKINKFKFNEIIILLDEFLRKANLDWSTKSKDKDLIVFGQLIIDTIHIVKTCALLIHSISPKGTELIAEYMNLGAKMFDWNNADKTIFEIEENICFKEIPPKFDFFKKHESQLKDN